MSEWRNLVCGAMIVILPTSLVAQNSGRAMLHNDGGTYLNDSPAPNSTAIFPDSLVQTLKGHSARIDAEGTAAQLPPETVVQFQGNLFVLVQGSLQMDTAREMEVLVGCITVSPITSARTRYDVTDVDGKVKVTAYENDLKVYHHGAGRGAKQSAGSEVTVHQGEQVTREERCGAAARPVQGVAAKGGLLSSRYAEVAGVVAIGFACWVVCRGDDPISPSKP